MASAYDKASLVMLPHAVKEDKLYSVKPEDRSGDFTFSRGSDIEATRVNSSGLIEKAKVNLLTYSNDFSNAAWVKTNVSLTSGQSGYDGSSNAWKLESTASGSSQINQTTSNASIKTHSIYAKAGSVSTLKIWVGSVKEFNLSTGTTASSNSKITDVGNGWYRCEVFDVFQNLNPFFTASTAGDFIFIQDAQVNYGLVAQDYVDTTTTSVVEGLTADLPRLDYSGGASCPSLLLEPSRTNLVTHSEYTDGTNWSNEGSIIDEENTSETTSPEGVYNAVKLVSANATSEQWIQFTGVSVTSGNDCTISCFVKKSDYDYFHIRFTGVGSAFTAGSIWYDIANGTLGTTESGITGTIEDYGNGWYRISATKEAIATAFGAVRFQLASSDNIDAVVGDGSKGTYAYGFQAEIGSYPTSYIPTYGTSAGRGADSCSKTGISDLIGQTEGTLFLDVAAIASESTNKRISISDGTNNNRVSISFTSATIIAFVVSGGVSSVANGLGISTPEEKHKIAVAYKENDFVIYVDGLQVIVATSGDVPVSMSEFKFSDGSGAPFFGNVDQALVFKTRLSNAELAALTTI